MANGSKISFPKSVLNNIAQGFRNVAGTEWLGPGKPQEVATKQPVRTWDFPALYNTGANPPGEDNQTDKGIGFSELRNFAKSYELMRIVIETCKDQLGKLDYTFKLRPLPDEDAKGLQARTKADTRLPALQKFFKYPEREHDFATWVRMILEEQLVTDSVTIYPRLTNGGDLYSLDLIDGATIVPLIDITGRRPAPPQIAYQQWISGKPIAKFTTDELFYCVKNPRVNKVYGFSPTEQVIFYASIALRRAAFQLATYTDGNIPAMFMRAPEEWTVEQIGAFQEYWDYLLNGIAANQVKGILIPGGTDPIFPQKDALKDEFDEWLARIICYCFSVSPNAFIKSLNRASSEEQRNQADEEGMSARMAYIKAVIERIIFQLWGVDDIEFHWIVNRKQDSLSQAEIDQIDVRNGIKSLDEVRKERGLHPIGIGNAVFTPQGIIFLDGSKPLVIAAAASEKPEEKPKNANPDA